MESRAEHALFFLATLSCLCVSADPQVPDVHTKLGSLRGKFMSVKGKENGVFAYLGVPFAKPPVGALRLTAPQPVEGWEGVRDATQQPPMCIQNKRIVRGLVDRHGGFLKDIPDISEDCLYLNVLVPANTAPDAKLPVMVRIHGGGFNIGSASMYDGSALAAYQDVIVVLIQYRMGLLGFLSTGDKHMPGNYGMLDQVQALKWVQEHIHNFGGDPDLVTIFGESAGGISVSLLLLSPLGKGLFHRAIAESGSAALSLILDKNPLRSMMRMANASGCSLESTEKMANCMRNHDLSTILALLEDETLQFTQNIDGHFLTKCVEDCYTKHEVIPVPLLTGVTNDEGGWMLSRYYAPLNWTEGVDRAHILNVLSRFYNEPNTELIKDMILEEYLGNGEDRVKNRNALTELMGDLMFTWPVIRSAKAHRDAGIPVYLFEYKHPPTFLQERRPNFVRADHGDEIFIVLGNCLTTAYSPHADKCSKDEEQLSKNLMNYWANFARTGSPNGDGLAPWPEFGRDENYLAIGLKEQVVEQHLKKARINFLTEILPKKIQEYIEERMKHDEL